MEENTMEGTVGRLDPMAVTWLEKYSDNVERIWSKLPKLARSIIITLSVFLLGATVRGEWIVIIVHLLKHFGFSPSTSHINNSTLNWEHLELQQFYLKDVGKYILGASVVAYSLYFLIGGFLHWYFYVRQRDKAEEWKCQPNKFMDPELELHEILVGSCSLLVTNTFSGILACYISNGGYSTVYYKFDEYGWTWFFLQFIVIFIYQDYVTYWLHRIYHWPFFYKNFHKLHHKYKQPTAFSVTAIHPVEILHIQITMCLPIFLIPTHWFPFYTIALYIYYHGIIDHSGINFKSFWWQPWQPDAIFHDNHHQYFHVNFGFNIYIWDKLHGTYRQKDRIYTEDLYYGKGKLVKDATEDEIREDIAERISENPLAYRNNRMEFELTENDLKKLK